MRSRFHGFPGASILSKKRIAGRGIGRRRAWARGLTLIQLMVIIGLIGIVAAVVVRMLLEPAG